MPKQTQERTIKINRAAPPHKSYRHIAIIFAVLAVLLILGVTYLALSKVTITLTPSDEQVTFDFTLTVADASANSTSTQVVLPGRIMSETAAVEEIFSVSSGKTVNALAEGTVTLYNDRGASQTLVATTRLLTPDNVLFRLKDKVTIPSNSTVQVKIYADQEGPSGNIPPTTFTVPGLSESLQKLVYAKSSAPMAGGTRKIGILTTSDIEQAKAEIIKTTADDIVAKFFNSLGSSKLTLIDTQIDSSDLTYDQALGEQVDSFTLSGNLTVTAVFADELQILEMAKNKLKESQGPKGEFINVDPSSLKYELINVDLENLEAKIKVSISGLATLDPAKDIFDKNLLVGFTEDDIKLYFSQFDSIQDVQVKFSPFWVKKVPILKDHIDIQIAK